MEIGKIIKKAQQGKFWLWVLNYFLMKYIPFNKPHKIRIKKLAADRVEVVLPYIKKNRNHLNGLHACALATAAEFSSGFLLLSKLDIKKYRLIMEKIEVVYHYQGKTEAKAVYAISDEEFNKQILEPLQTNEKLSYICKVEIMDLEQNLLCTANMHWQVKNWGKVKLKLS